MIFQDCAVTMGLKRKIFSSFYCQKILFLSLGTEKKKLIGLSLLFWQSVLVFCVAFFFAKRGGFYNIT